VKNCGNKNDKLLRSHVTYLAKPIKINCRQFIFKSGRPSFEEANVFVKTVPGTTNCIQCKSVYMYIIM